MLGKLEASNSSIFGKVLCVDSEANGHVELQKYKNDIWF